MGEAVAASRMGWHEGTLATNLCDMLTDSRCCLRWLGLSLLVVLASCQPAKAPSEQRPVPAHVLLFTFEGLRADHVSSLAYYRPTTAGAPDDPNYAKKPGLDYDALAVEGVQFPNCFAPTLDPSAALESLLRGTSPVALPADGLAPAQSQRPALAEAFRSSGFHTIACVGGEQSDARASLRDGFDVFEVHERDNDAVARAWFHARAAIENESIDHVLVWIHLSEIQPPFAPLDLPKIITERKLEGCFADPLYTGSANGSLEFLEQASRGEVQLTLADRDRILAAYDGEVARAVALMRAFLERWTYTVRDSFGNYVEAPHEDERWSKTMVVACGTSGAELGEHEGRWGKASTLHDSSLRVPLFFSHAESLPGRRILAEVVELADVAPTLCDWCGLTNQGARPGRSLVASLEGQDGDGAEPSVARAVSGDGAWTVRTERWRLIRDAKEERFALFDLRRDPRESHDVADSEPAVVAELVQRFAQPGD